MPCGGISPRRITTSAPKRVAARCVHAKRRAVRMPQIQDGQTTYPNVRNNKKEREKERKKQSKQNTRICRGISSQLPTVMSSPVCPNHTMHACNAAALYVVDIDVCPPVPEKPCVFPIPWCWNTDRTPPAKQGGEGDRRFRHQRRVVFCAVSSGSKPVSCPCPNSKYYSSAPVHSCSHHHHSIIIVLGAFFCGLVSW